jgi:peptide/nickel transport system ATP-binding protein
MSTHLLDVRNLKKHFPTRSGMLHAVDGVSFMVQRGKTLGLVGESGCGKSTTGRVILRLLNPTEGEVFFESEDLLALNKKAMQKKRSEMQIIFQDPYSSLDPRKTVSEAIAEPMRYSSASMSSKERMERVFALMETVGLAGRLVNTYPHELDGGRRQRIGIARALSTNPKLIVCDEPVSALDVSIQAQILNLMQDLQQQRNLTYIFITHDLSVVNHIADEIAGMYLGKIVEKAPVDTLFNNPAHPYTQALLCAIPTPNLHHKKQRNIMKGELSSPINPEPGCRFYKRCPHAVNSCRGAELPLIEIEPEHYVACMMQMGSVSAS